MNKTRYFKNNGREYVFTDYNMKRPMLNYSWNKIFLSAFNHMLTGKGLYCNKSSITASYVDLRGRVKLINDGNRYFYFKDMDSGEYWNPGYYPSNRKLDAYSCTMGLGYAKYYSRFMGIEVNAKVFVNDCDPVEIWTFHIKNISDVKRRIKFFPVVEWALEGYTARCDYFSNLYTEYNSEKNIITAYNKSVEAPHERYNGFMAVNRKPQGFDTGLEAFLGTYGTFTLPEAVIRGKCSNYIASCEKLAGVFENEFILEPGKEERIDVLIGCIKSMDEAVSMTDKLFTKGQIEEDFEKLLAKKEEMIQNVYIQTPDERINNIFNTWTKQQVFLCSETGRGVSRGYRDVLQDAWGNASFNPEDSRRKILEALAHQYKDGHAPRGWLPINPLYYSDSPVWIPMAVNEYLKESGEYSFLDITVPFLDGDEGTVLEHCLRAVRHLYNDKGAHGLVLAHMGDWNDSMTGLGAGGRGESAWTSIALHFALIQMQEIAAIVLKNNDLLAEMKEMADKVREVVNKVAWDGQWYLEGYNDDGEKVGTHTEAEGRIFLNSQSWAAISCIAPPERLKTAFEKVDELLDSPYGPLTLYPAYTKTNMKIGRLTSFIPGIWENGTPYCHGGAFKIFADCIMGRGNKAYDTMAKIIPDSPYNLIEHSGCEPYAFTNMYLGPENDNAGFAMFGWLTGTAGWMFRALTQAILGFIPGYDEIILEPCIPSSWRECTIRRKYRQNTYEIRIENPDGVEKGIKRILVDGCEVEGNRIEYKEDKKLHKVIVVMG